jgi:hypothetical protein
MHPSKRWQHDQKFLLPVAFAEGNHLRGIALPGARSVDPSGVARADPEQVNIGGRTVRRQLPEEELIPSVPEREVFRFVNTMDDPFGKPGMETGTLVDANVAVNARPVPQFASRQNATRVVVRALPSGTSAASAGAPRRPNAAETLHRN